MLLEMVYCLLFCLFIELQFKLNYIIVNEGNGFSFTLPDIDIGTIKEQDMIQLPQNKNSHCFSSKYYERNDLSVLNHGLWRKILY